MTNIKFRYVFKNLFDDISMYYFTIEEIENGIVNEILNSGMRSNGYVITNREAYVGLQDSSGIDIYEGDVVEFRKYMDEENIIRSEIKDLRNMWAEQIAHDSGNGLKVIGNIYENPELLENE